MMDTFSFARKLQCDWASYYVCQPLKGTDLYSSFQHLMDPRTKDESYSKTINPGRSAARGEFAYSENQETAKELQAGWEIFELDSSRTFNANEHNEIWFTFNLVANSWITLVIQVNQNSQINTLAFSNHSDILLMLL